MAATPSTMLMPFGAEAPPFSLPNACDARGGVVRLSEFDGRTALVVMFICNHCPFVKHVLPEIKRLAMDYIPRHVAFVAISSNDVEHYPDDSPQKMGELARQQAWPFPYLYDQSQEVAKAYKAACTPDFYVFDQDQRLVYRGQLDDSRPNSGAPVTGRDVRGALDLLLAGKPVPPSASKPSIGCNIKWRPGLEPEYAR